MFGKFFLGRSSSSSLFLLSPPIHDHCPPAMPFLICMQVWIAPNWTGGASTSNTSRQSHSQLLLLLSHMFCWFFLCLAPPHIILCSPKSLQQYILRRLMCCCLLEPPTPCSSPPAAVRSVRVPNRRRLRRSTRWGAWLAGWPLHSYNLGLAAASDSWWPRTE